MVAANMALPVKQPQHPRPKGGAPDHHQYAWLSQKADRTCKAVNGAYGHMIPSPDDSSNSWEARAFAEDASSLAAGMWPPRAYPCSFCHREFRSAQALGGHMNVHRRDRARMRHSSPPPPFHAAHNVSLQPSNLIHKSQHGCSSSTGLNPRICPEIYPNECIPKANVLPAARPLSAPMSPQNSTAFLAARYPSDMAASFPLRLHLLASEAASTLMLPQAEPSDQLSLWPVSALGSGHPCHSTIGPGITLGSATNTSSRSMPSSSNSTSSSSIVLNCAVTALVGATPCKRARLDAPIIQLEDESPKKKSNLTTNSDYQPYQDIRLKNCSKDDGITQAQADQQALNVFNIHVNENIHMQHERVEACGEYVDLELRLGQRPP